MLIVADITLTVAEEADRIAVVVAKAATTLIIEG